VDQRGPHRRAAAPARPGGTGATLTSAQVADLFRAGTMFREHAFWRVIYDSAARVDEVVGLDGALTCQGGAPTGRSPHRDDGWIRWRDSSGEL
jgi:hypothetical protein